MHGIEFVGRVYGLSFTDISKICEVTPQYIQSCAKLDKEGKPRRKLSEEHLEKLSEHFSLPVDFFQKELNVIEEITVKMAYELYITNIDSEENKTYFSDEYNKLSKQRRKEETIQSIREILFNEPEQYKKFSDEWKMAVYPPQIINSVLNHFNNCTPEQLLKLKSLVARFPDIDQEEFEKKESAFLKELQELMLKHGIIKGMIK